MFGIFCSLVAIGLIFHEYMMGRGEDWYAVAIPLNLFFITVHATRVIKEGK